MYSQNNEDSIIVEYFKNKHGHNYKGALLDLGANDGRTLSNSLRLIQMGWIGTLVEASEIAFNKCVKEHENNESIQIINIGVGEKNCELVFHESDKHLSDNDYSLVSTFDKSEMQRWGVNQKFHTKTMKCVDVPTLLSMSRIKQFDFITMDIEGFEVVVLPQMDLSYVKCLCIEYNGKQDLAQYYIEYCKRFELIEYNRNNENIIFVR